MDNVPVKETYAEPEPDEVGATKLMPSRKLVEETAVDNEETVCAVLQKSIDYTHVNCILEEKRMESYRWLRRALLESKTVHVDRAYFRVEEK